MRTDLPPLVIGAQKAVTEGSWLAWRADGGFEGSEFVFSQSCLHHPPFLNLPLWGSILECEASSGVNITSARQNLR